MAAMKSNKTEIITFKVDGSLLDAMEGIPNRSEFIRAAVLQALDSACPLCQGTGIMTPEQKDHWDSFTADHQIEECDDCHALHLICENRPKQKLSKREKK
jgi:hypothetical protein